MQKFEKPRISPISLPLLYKTGLGHFFEVFVLVLAKAVLVLTLDGLKDLINWGLKTKKVLRPFFDLKDLKILILDEAKLD